MASTSVPRPAAVPPALTAAYYPLQGFSAKANEDQYRRNIDLLLNGQAKGWQALAWGYYERIGELRAIAHYVSNLLSKMTLYAARATADPFNPERLPPSHPASRAVADFAGGFDGQAELMAALAIQLTIAGDTILAGPWDMRTRGVFPFDRWRAYSTEEITSRNGVLYYKTIQRRDEKLPPSVAAFRAWRPSPRRWWEAESPTKSALQILREIDLLDAHVHSSAVSRLAGAGLMLLPDEITVPSDEVDADGQEVDPFVRHLAEVMSIAMKKPESAAARVPVMLRGPADALKEVRVLNFDTPFDERVPELRLGALRRLGLAMDIPPEVLTGTAEGTGWSAWQTLTQAINYHALPLAMVATGTLSQGWLRPFLKKQRDNNLTDSELSQLVLWPDANNLRVRPNEAEETTAAYDRFEADSDALRLVSGLAAETKPTDTELARQILLALVRTNPSMAGYAVNALREEFGVKKLPPFQEKIEAVQVQRSNEGKASRSEVSSRVGEANSPERTDVVPGQRSQDKLVDPPPVPPVNSDPNNNEQGRP